MPATVFPLHSRYGHAMVTPAMARCTGAMVLGCEATANVIAGQLADMKVDVVFLGTDGLGSQTNAY